MRVIIASAGLLSAFAGFPWLTALCIVALALRYRAWEAVFLGLIVDLLWVPSDISFAVFPYFTIGSILIVWLFEPLRVQFLR